MIVYIAGAIAGEPNYKAIFAKAAERLKAEGHIVLSPAMLPEGMPRDRYMPICLAMLQQADAIYTLKNWPESPGADLERRYAKYQQKIWRDEMGEIIRGVYDPEREAALAVANDG